MRAANTLLGSILLCATTVAANAQEPPPLIAPFGAEILVSEVLLDVLVTDRKGNAILGLQPSDFLVSEGDRPVEVTAAEFYSHRALEGSTAPVAPAARFLLFFFDDQRGRNADVPGLLNRQVGAGRDAREFLAHALTPTDWVAILGYDFKLRLFADFTRDREVLARAVEAATTGKPDRGNWPSRQPVEEGTPSLSRRLPAGDELRDQTATIYEAITLISEASTSIYGRKNLLLFTAGFGRMNRFRQYEPDPRYYEPMIESLNDANVAVYAFDLTEPGTRHPFADAMSQISSDTGGRYFADLSQFEAALTRVAAETSGYYLVSYRATHPSGLRGFQHVKVRLANPELKLTARRGYRFGD